VGGGGGQNPSRETAPSVKELCKLKRRERSLS
jgi:hypothetical protein